MSLHTFIEYYYRPIQPLTFETLWDSCGKAGLSCNNAQDGTSVGLSDDGTERPVTPGDLKDLIRKNECPTLVCRSDRDPALLAYARVKQVNEILVQESVETDLLPLEQRILLVKHFIHRFERSAGLLVADMFGDSREYVNWEKVAADPPTPLPDTIPTAVSPTVLGIAKARLDMKLFTGFAVTTVADSAILQRPPLLDEFPQWLAAYYNRVCEVSNA